MPRFQRRIDRAVVALTALLLLVFPSRSLAETALPVDAVPLVIMTADGEKSFRVEIADTDEERAVGLMNRETMPSDQGMLFDFESTRDVHMWMKNTILSLDMLFIRSDGTIAGIAENTVPFSEAIISSPGPVAYVLELNAGTAAREGISAGDRAVHPAIGP